MSDFDLSFMVAVPEFIRFGEASYCFVFVLNNSADKTTFVKQVRIDSQRMVQIERERKLILHVIPGIFELPCNYDVKFGGCVTRCLLK